MQTAEKFLASILIKEDPEWLSAEICALSQSGWENLVCTARKHGLAAQLFDRLTKSKQPSESREKAQSLKHIYLNNVVRGMRLSHELSNILLHLNKNDIPVIVLKGPHLAEMVYKDWALRPMGDFDLMIKRNDLCRAIAAMDILGYEASGKFLIESMVNEQPHLPGFFKEGKIPVELHWTLEKPLGPFKIDIDGVWQRAQPANIAGVDTLVLSIEDLIIYHCIHVSYRHRFAFGLLPLYDVSQIIKVLGESINWDRLRRQAEAWGALRCVSLTLFLSSELFEAEIGPEFMKSIRPPDLDGDILKKAMGLVFSVGEGRIEMTGNLIQVWREKSFSSKVKRLLKNTFPPPHVLGGIYPVDPSAKRVYLYYPVRLKDVLLRHGKTLLSLLRRDADAVAQAQSEEEGYILADWLTSK